MQDLDLPLPSVIRQKLMRECWLKTEAEPNFRFIYSIMISPEKQVCNTN